LLLVSDAAISALRVFGVFRDTATVFSGLTLDRWGLRIFDFHPNAANAREPDPCRVGASTYRHRITTHPLQIENVQRPVSSLIIRHHYQCPVVEDQPTINPDGYHRWSLG